MPFRKTDVRKCFSRSLRRLHGLCSIALSNYSGVVCLASRAYRQDNMAERIFIAIPNDCRCANGLNLLNWSLFWEETPTIFFRFCSLENRAFLNEKRKVCLSKGLPFVVRSMMDATSWWWRDLSCFWAWFSYQRIELVARRTKSPLS